MNEINFASYADDNIPYVAGDIIVIDVINSLVKWFADNQMEANKDKCHLL